MSTANVPEHSSTEQPPPYQGGQGLGQQHLALPVLNDEQRLSMEDEATPLPDGWIRQFDQNSNHHFYVDTKANPPRSIWVHPYDDPEFRKSHGMPPLGEEKHVGAFSDKKHQNEDKEGQASGSSSNSNVKERGFFGKLKDSAIGTKEEREAEKRARLQREREAQERYLERRRQLIEAQNAARSSYPNSPLFHNAGYGRPMYAPPSMAYGRQRRRGGGGMGLPLAGGLLGGMLLGSALDGDGFGGGDFGGGDFGGGDFGGGDFGF